MALTPLWNGASNVPPAMVLDTNAVLDWMVFKDDRMSIAAAAVMSGSVRWLACPRMREELAHTLEYVDLAKWQPDRLRVMATFDHHAHMQPSPPAAPPGLRCTDRHDQIFIDLAVAGQARWLLTHDRALLKLGRRALPYAVHVMTPMAWSSLNACPSAAAAGSEQKKGSLSCPS